MNSVQIVGNLTRDVEIRYSQNGSAIGNVGIAVNKKWKDQQGQEKESVMFIDLTMFGRTAEIANQYLRKSSKVGIVGQLDFQQWTAQDGSKRSKHVVVVKDLEMLGTRDGGNRANEDAQADRQGGYGDQYSNGAQPNQGNSGYQNQNQNQGGGTTHQPHQNNGGGQTYQQPKNNGYQDQQKGNP